MSSTRGLSGFSSPQLPYRSSVPASRSTTNGISYLSKTDRRASNLSLGTGAPLSRLAKGLNMSSVQRSLVSTELAFQAS